MLLLRSTQVHVQFSLHSSRQYILGNKKPDDGYVCADDGYVCAYDGYVCADDGYVCAFN